MDAQTNFPSVICQRRIIKSCLIKDNRKHRGIHNEEFKSDTDGKVEASNKAIQFTVMCWTLHAMTHLWTCESAGFSFLIWSLKANPKVIHIQ